MCSLCTCPVTPISNWPPVHPAAAPPLRGCRRPCTHSTNTARAEAGGIQGGSPPCAGGPGTRRSLAYLCLLSLREKVGRGADHGKAMISRSARIGGCRDYQSRKISPGLGAERPKGGSQGPCPCITRPGTEAPHFYKNPASKQNTRCGIERTINPPSGSGQSSKKINTLCPR